MTLGDYMAVKESVEGHYEVLEEPYGKIYKWVPAYALIECGCGQLFSTEGTIATSCPTCDADYTGVDLRLGESKPLKEDEAYYSTRHEHEAWMKGEEDHLPHPKRLYSWGLFSGLAANDEINQIVDVLYGS